MSDGPVAGDLAMFNKMGGLVDSGIPAVGPGAAITGSGTSPHLPRFTAPTVLANSAYQDAGATTLTVALLTATDLFDSALVVTNSTTDTDHGIAITAAATKTAKGFFEIDGIGDDPGFVPEITTFRARGVGGALTNLVSGDNIGFWELTGQGSVIAIQGVRLGATTTEDWVATFGAAFSVQTIANGETTLSTRLFVNGSGNTEIDNGVFLQSYSVSVPLTGGTVNIGQHIRSQVLNPAGTLATLSVNLPPAAGAFDRQRVSLSTTQQVTAMTLGCTGGNVATGFAQPFTMTAGAALTFVYQSSSTTWFISG